MFIKNTSGVYFNLDSSATIFAKADGLENHNFTGAVFILLQNGETRKVESYDSVETAEKVVEKIMLEYEKLGIVIFDLSTLEEISRKDKVYKDFEKQNLNNVVNTLNKMDTKSGDMILAFTVEQYKKKKAREKVNYVAFSKHYLDEDVEKRIQQVYGIIGCRFMDYEEVIIDGISYYVWFDEEVTSFNLGTPTLYLGSSNMIIFGNFIFMRAGKVPHILDCAGLEKEDIIRILNFYDKQLPKLENCWLTCNTAI